MEDGEGDEGVERQREDLLGEAWKLLAPGAGMVARCGGTHGTMAAEEAWLSLGRSLVDGSNGGSKLRRLVSGSFQMEERVRERLVETRSEREFVDPVPGGVYRLHSSLRESRALDIPTLK